MKCNCQKKKETSAPSEAIVTEKNVVYKVTTISDQTPHIYVGVTEKDSYYKDATALSTNILSEKV